MRLARAVHSYSGLVKMYETCDEHIKIIYRDIIVHIDNIVPEGHFELVTVKNDE